MLTIARLSKWGVKYYSDTARAVEATLQDQRSSERVAAGVSVGAAEPVTGASDHDESAVERSKRSAGGGLGEYYTEHNTRAPVWITAGDRPTVEGIVGVTDGVTASNDAVDKWMQEGVAPSGATGQKIPEALSGKRAPVHGFDLTFCAPKSISIMRGCATGSDEADVLRRAHDTAVRSAMEYLAEHAGYSRVPNKKTGKKDLVKLPGLTAAAYQHETSRAGDPHLHTHVVMPNRQARADGKLVSIDSKSLYHEARAAGTIYQAVLRDEVARELGWMWRDVDTRTGQAELAMVSRQSIKDWSKRATRLREWAQQHYGDRTSAPSPKQLEVAQRATRPVKAEELTWAQLQQKWADDSRTVTVDHDGHNQAAEKFAARDRTIPDARSIREWVAAADKTELTRADLVEILAAHWPTLAQDLPADDVRGGIEAATAGVLLPIQASREAHQREGSITYTSEEIVLEELEALEAAVESDEDTRFFVDRDADIAPFKLSEDQSEAISEIAASPHRVQVVQAPAGAGKTRSLKALRHIVEDNRYRNHRANMWVLAPTGKAADGAAQDGAAAHERCATIAKILGDIDRDDHAASLPFGKRDVIVVDEAGMVGNDKIARLIAHTKETGAKLVLVGDSHQLQPVAARAGLFDDLHRNLPWSHDYRQVFRVRSEEERKAGLWLRHGTGLEKRAAISWYGSNDRLHAGDEVVMADKAWNAFVDDRDAGRDTMLVAGTREMVWSLNRRTQQYLHGHDDVDREIQYGRQVSAHSVPIANEHRAMIGDTIITRSNDPTLAIAPHKEGDDVDQVRNGHRWTVHNILADGTIHAVRTHDDARAVLTPDYVRENVDLGYAATVHTAQGATVDRTHALINTGRATAEMLYVAITRGRDRNDIYMQHSDDISDHGHEPHRDPDDIIEYERPVAASMMHQVVARSSRQRTTMQAIDDAHHDNNAAPWTGRARDIADALRQRAHDAYDHDNNRRRGRTDDAARDAGRTDDGPTLDL